MEIKSYEKNNIANIKLKKKFNIEEVERFEKEISQYFKDSTDSITINFSDLDYIDSSALGSLIKAMNTAKNYKIDFYLYNMTQNIYHIFQLAHLDKFFTITNKDELKKIFPEINL